MDARPLMKRPRVYGSESKCKAALSRQIERGEALLDQAAGVRKRVDAAAAAGDPPWATALYIEAEWAKEFRRWFNAAQKAMVGVPTRSDGGCWAYSREGCLHR